MRKVLIRRADGLFASCTFHGIVWKVAIQARDRKRHGARGRRAENVKRLQNYPDPMEVVNRYGADAFAITSFPHRRSGEDLRFSEKVEDVHKKIIMRLQNVVSFYELYADVSSTDFSLPTTHSVLDQWIVAHTVN